MRSSSKSIFQLILLTLAIACLHLVAVDRVIAFQRSEVIARTVSWSEVLKTREIKLPICNPSRTALDTTQFQIEIVSLPSGSAIDPSTVRSVRMSYENGDYLIVRVSNNVRRPVNQDDELRIIVRLPASQADAEVTRLEQTVCAFPAMLPEVLAREKMSNEKRLLFSPSLSFPAGGNAEMAANGILYRRSALSFGGLVDQIDLSLAMDKGSEEQADPNFFNIGLNLKKIIPFHFKRTKRALRSYRTALRQVQSLRNLNVSEVAADTAIADSNRFLATAVDHTAELKNAFFRDIEISVLSPRLELNFSGLRPGPVTNFINNSELQIRTASKPFISKNLFWSLQLLPLGLETGVTLRNRDNVGQKGAGIVRLNTGGSAKLKFRFPCRDDLLTDRIELEMKAINRYLFNEESLFNPITKRNDLLVKGNRYWAQVDLRYVFGFRVPFPTRIFGFKLPNITRKPALTLSYKNGYAPPVYKFTNTVTFRFTLASGDENNSDEIRVSKEDLLKP